MFENLNISNDTKAKICTLIPVFIKLRAENFTQEEMANHMEVSRRTLIEFESGRSFNFELFEGYCGMFGYEIAVWQK